MNDFDGKQLHSPRIHASASPVQADTPPSRLHRIRQVRRQQEISLRSAARHLQMDVIEVKTLEKETTDMLLTTLYRWQRALDVPVTSLLVDDDYSLSGPVLKRARMVRLMKTAVMILETVKGGPPQEMAQTLVDQLLEIMPELRTVHAWPLVGQRRSPDECGRIGEHLVPHDLFFSIGQ